MSLRSVRTRIVVGVSAWLLGVGAATGGSLLAVSRLGADFIAAPQQLTVAEVNQALAKDKEATEGATPVPSVSLGSTSSPITKRSARAGQSAGGSGPQATAATLLTSAGGSVWASCSDPSAVLQSWSPAQGYEVRNVNRGGGSPQVTFSSQSSTVTMFVTCQGGVPSASISQQGAHGGGGGGGGGGGDG